MAFSTLKEPNVTAKACRTQLPPSLPPPQQPPALPPPPHTLAVHPGAWFLLILSALASHGPCSTARSEAGSQSFCLF